MAKETCKQYSFPTIVYDSNKEPIEATVVNCSKCPNRCVCDGGKNIYKIEIPDGVGEVN
jgi:hypothetical protein